MVQWCICQARTPEERRNTFKSWERDDRAFFASGACHILADLFVGFIRTKALRWYVSSLTRLLADIMSTPRTVIGSLTTMVGRKNLNYYGLLKRLALRSTLDGVMQSMSLGRRLIRWRLFARRTHTGCLGNSHISPGIMLINTSNSSVRYLPKSSRRLRYSAVYEFAPLMLLEDILDSYFDLECKFIVVLRI